MLFSSEVAVSCSQCGKICEIEALKDAQPIGPERDVACPICDHKLATSGAWRVRLGQGTESKTVPPEKKTMRPTADAASSTHPAHGATYPSDTGKDVPQPCQSRIIIRLESEAGIFGSSVLETGFGCARLE